MNTIMRDLVTDPIDQHAIRWMETFGRTADLGDLRANAGLAIHAFDKRRRKGIFPADQQSDGFRHCPTVRKGYWVGTRLVADCAHDVNPEHIATCRITAFSPVVCAITNAVTFP